MNQIIHVGKYWTVIIYYELSEDNIDQFIKVLKRARCPQEELQGVREIALNEGVTFTNPHQRLSIMGIGKATSGDEVFDTVIHELDHVQMAICNYYGIKKDSEQAAYLIGDMAKRMYHSLLILLKDYSREEF